MKTLLVILCLLVARMAGAADYFVHLTDTQMISARFPHLYPQMRDYLCRLHPAAVFFTGDAFQPGYGVSQAEQFRRTAAFAADLTACGVPFFFAPGNHDYVDGSTDRSTIMDNYFSPPAGAIPKDSGSVANYYADLSLGGRSYRVLSLEYAPRSAVVEWADGVLTSYETENPTGRAILLTHVWLYREGIRYDWSSFGSSQIYSPHASPCLFTPEQGTNDGEELWNALGLPHSSVRIVLSGHITVAHRTDSRADGTKCYQAAGDFSDRPRDAWMQVYKIDGDSIDVVTVSPWQYASWSGSSFHVDVQ